MKHSVHILTFCLALLIYGCQPNSSDKKITEGFSKLRVIVQDSSDFYLEKIIAEGSKRKFELSGYYDSSINGQPFFCDSLPNGEYDIIFNSVLNKDFRTPITLIKDTTIFIKKSELNNYDTLTTTGELFNNLNPRDTIYIGLHTRGCFHNRYIRTLIYKKGDNFTLHFSMDTSHDSRYPKIAEIKKDLPPSFSDTLKKFGLSLNEGFFEQEKKRKVYEELKRTDTTSLKGDLIWFGSTTFSTIYITKGNKIFLLTNNGINEIPYYEEFMKSLNLFSKKSGS